MLVVFAVVVAVVIIHIYACAMHHFMYAKKLRHPNILSVTATLDTDNPNETTTSNSGGGGNSGGASNSASSGGAAANTNSTLPSPTTVSNNNNNNNNTGDLIIVTEPCIPFSVWLQQQQHKQDPNQQPQPTIDQLEPPGINVLVHDKPAKRDTWAPHASAGWYISPAMKSYRCFKCFTQN